MTPESAVLMARYNHWMNDRLYAAAATLDHETLTADRGAFFGSLLATLNHIAVADTIWLHRFAQHKTGFASLAALTEFPQPSRLDQSLAPDLPGLQQHRTRLDDLIESWAAELTPAHFAGDITYRNMAGTPYCRPFGALLLHFFNHQTHHRGQATTLLSQNGVDVGVTDLLTLIPSAGA